MSQLIHIDNSKQSLPGICWNYTDNKTNHNQEKRKRSKTKSPNTFFKNTKRTRRKPYNITKLNADQWALTHGL